MTSEVQMDATWGALSELEASARQQAMEERFARLAARGEDERLAETEAMIRAEYALDDPALHDFTASRLRALIALEQRDPAQANAGVRAYDAVFEKLPAEMAMKRASVVQTVARSDLSGDEIDVLFELIPSLVQTLPHARQDALQQTASQDRVEAARERHKDKPFWKFW
jgi:hypothetical protein